MNGPDCRFRPCLGQLHPCELRIMLGQNAAAARSRLTWRQAAHPSGAARHRKRVCDGNFSISECDPAHM
jgi:hypothetical protein